MIRAARLLLRHSVLALLAVAMLSLPFAHRVGAAPVTKDMAQFLSSGGLYADICGETGEHPSGGCESCRIINAAMLAQPAAIALAQNLPRAASTQPARREFTVQPSPQNTPPVRAPPRLT